MAQQQNKNNSQPHQYQNTHNASQTNTYHKTNNKNKTRPTLCRRRVYAAGALAKKTPTEQNTDKHSKNEY